jgi:hypothetical protein
VARIRSIKPEYWKDGAIRRLSDSCALFFISLWNFCDDEGKCQNDSFELSSNIPRFKSQHISKWLQILFNSGLIQFSTDFKWVSVVNWGHQKIDRPQIPKILKKDIEWIPVVTKDQSSNALRMIDERSTSIRRKDRIGKDRIGKDSTSLVKQESLGAIEPIGSGGLQPAPELQPSQIFIGTYVKAFQKRYGENTRPSVTRKVAGQVKNMLLDITLDRACALIQVYLQMDDKWFVTKCHDFGSFLENLSKIGLALDTGRSLDQKETIDWAELCGEKK